MSRKKNKSKGKQRRKPNTHKPAIAVSYECSERTYMVLDIRAQVVALIQEDKRGGWAKLHEEGYGDLPIFGPIEVTPEVIEELNAASHRELNVIGPIVAGTVGEPITKHLDGDWRAGQVKATAYNPVEVKNKHGRSQPYGGELRASMGELASVKRRLLSRK